MSMTLRGTAGAALLATMLVVGGAGGAFAQGTPAPAAPAAPAPGMPPKIELSMAQLTLAAEVVKLSGMSRSMDLIVPQMVQRARQLFVQTRPELAAEIDKSIANLQPEFDKLTGEAQVIAANSFGSKLTEAELKDLRTFFTSPTGKKFVEAQPAIIDDMFRNLETFSQRLSQVVVDRLREDMKKRGHTL